MNNTLTTNNNNGQSIAQPRIPRKRSNNNHNKNDKEQQPQDNNIPWILKHSAIHPCPSNANLAMFLANRALNFSGSVARPSFFLQPEDLQGKAPLFLTVTGGCPAKPPLTGLPRNPSMQAGKLGARSFLDWERTSTTADHQIFMITTLILLKILWYSRCDCIASQIWAPQKDVILVCVCVWIRGFVIQAAQREGGSGSIWVLCATSPNATILSNHRC